DDDREGVDRVAFVRASLQGMDVVSKITSNRREFERDVRSGLWNTYMVMGKEPVLSDELREAVFRGDGLVLVGWKGSSEAELDEALGARIHGHLSGKHHVLRMLDGPLGPAQTLSVRGEAAKLRVESATVAGTMGRGIPVLSVHPFGQGRTVAMAF